MEVAGVTSKTAARREEFAAKRGITAYASLDEMLPEVDVIDNCTPGYAHEPVCVAAFEAGKHAIVTNKGPVALAYRSLIEQADRKGLFFGYEGTVMSGTPALRLAQTALKALQQVRVRRYILALIEVGHEIADFL